MPLEEICGYMNISLLADEEIDRIYCTSGITGWDYPEGISIPVLMYHAVDDNVWGYADLFISPETMESHLQYLTENGFDLIHFEDMKNLDQYDKPVILTVDDGYLDNYTNLYPLLQKYNAKATIFVVTSSIGHLGTSMTPEQVKELADSELVSIQSHTVSHLVLRTLDDARQTEEMVRSKLEVARLSGREPFVVSYPTGQYNLYTLQTAAEHYRFAVIVEPETYITGSDPVRICRYNIRPTTTLENLATMVADAGKVSE
jgi:peptidoglycan/xylan/chitin deacetylase (PgdA/CDA1 family)